VKGGEWDKRNTVEILCSVGAGEEEHCKETVLSREEGRIRGSVQSKYKHQTQVTQSIRPGVR
jgi:hypothetical protein